MANQEKEKKDPCDELDVEWRDAVAAETLQQLNSRIAELAKEEARNQQSKSEDKDLAQKKEDVATASQQYRTATKGYKLRLKFIMRVLRDQSKL